MAQSVMDMVAQAKSRVPAISPADADKLRGRDDVLFVDVRDADEVAKTGKVAGALNVSRGMLEFRADASTPFHNEAFDTSKTIVLYCASGGRSALAGQALLELGYTKVFNLGGFKGWADESLPVDA